MIGLIDCNNFFVSCERVFQPKLQRKPTIVLSSNDGCVISRSQEVKDLGIPMGIALFKIKELVEQHKVNLCSTNFVLYRDMSRRVMETIQSVVEECEVYSVDEAFFTIPEHAEPYEFCKKIRDRVMLCTGIPTSIGVGQTKTLAKLANSKAKKTSDHIYVIPGDKERIELLQETSVGGIWGIGRGFSERLVQSGIKTALSLSETSDERIRAIFGLHGLHTAYELRGSVIEPVSTSSDARKSIISSRSFGKRITNKGELWNSVAYHVGTLAKELREEKQVTHCLRIGLYVNRFRGDKRFSKSEEHVFARPTSDTKLFLKSAREMFEKIWTPGGVYSKSGASVTCLVSQDRFVQETLFDVPEEEVEGGLDSLLDELHTKFGAGKVVLGELLTPYKDNSWLPKSNMKSGEFTTSWNDIPIVQKRISQKSL